MAGRMAGVTQPLPLPRRVCLRRASGASLSAVRAKAGGRAAARLPDPRWAGCAKRIGDKAGTPRSTPGHAAAATGKNSRGDVTQTSLSDREGATFADVKR